MRRAGIAWTGCLVVMLAAFMLLQVPTTAQAGEKDFIRLIAPNAPGSTVDFTARLLSPALSKALGKEVVVENLPGAGGIIGTQQLVRAPKDGSTIGIVSDNHVIIPSIYKDVPYDAIKDVTPISILAINTLVLVTNTNVQARTVKELIELAKSQPGKLSYGSAGNGSVLHLAAELFCSEAGVKITHVPYKGGSQLLADLMGGHVHMGMVGMSTVAEQIKAGKINALAVSTPKRTSVFPDVPTLVEAGLPNYSFTTWIAMIAPGNLPQPVVQRLNGAALDTLKLKEVRDGLAAQGLEIVGSTAEEAAKLFAADIVKKAQIVKQSGAKMQ
jgi:tripartite-type tricarboxylate transporter receptor subunit TctC